MEDKSLKDKAVKIQGKQYVLVQDRVLYFNEHYPKGSIVTELLSEPNGARVVVKATIVPDCSAVSEDGFDRLFTAHSQAVVGEGMVNKTAALENAETSAVGRALAFMGIGVIESIASADEMVKATSKPAPKPAAPAARTVPVTKTKSPEQIELAKKKHIAEQCDQMSLVTGDKLDAPEDYARFVATQTGLALEPEHFDAIIKRLSSLAKRYL
jgi:hypothetical protein